jgi:hypothetical protein
MPVTVAGRWSGGIIVGATNDNAARGRRGIGDGLNLLGLIDDPGDRRLDLRVG